MEPHKLHVPKILCSIYHINKTVPDHINLKIAVIVCVFTVTVN